MAPYVDLDAVGRREGLEIWRVKNFDLVSVPKNEYGQFYTGDAYVCLNTTEDRTWDLHFWLGENATTDEMGTAAIAAVKIDDALGGRPVQHREVQKHESSLFLSYFPHGVRYMNGGYESGFHHVEDTFDNFEPRLFHCKGKRNVRCTQVDCDVSSLNIGDVFILDLGRELYIWMPPECGRLEKIKGMEMARHISQEERHCRAHVNVLDSDWDTDETFWSYFGGVSNASNIGSAREDDEIYWQRSFEGVILYRVSDASGRMEVSEVSDGEVTHSQLDSQKAYTRILLSWDAFILDAASSGIFVWVGRGCNIDERRKALSWGENYIKQKNLPSWTQVTLVREGDEPPSFTQWFGDWNEARASYKPRLYQVCDRSGKLVVEEIANFNQESLDGDDVMLLDTYDQIYVWIGAGASEQEKEGATELAERYLQQKALPRHAGTNIVTVYQGSEPGSFKAKFRSWDDDLFQSNARSVENIKRRLFNQ